MLFKHQLHYGKFFSPDGDGGGAGGANAGQQGNEGNQGEGNGQQGAGAHQGAGNQGQQGGNDASPSANKLIKDFASQRGITVEALLSQFTELENKGKTELQRLEGERDGYKSQAESAAQELRQVRAEAAVLTAATQARAVDPDAILALAMNRLEFDKDGKPSNVSAVIEALRTERPERFKAAEGSGDGGKGGSGTPPEFSGGMDRLRYAYENESKSGKSAR